MRYPCGASYVFIVFGCSKDYCLQPEGNNKPASDSAMANLSNRRLVEDNPWLARIVPSMQAAVIYTDQTLKYCLWFTQGVFLPSTINIRAAVRMYRDKIKARGRGSCYRMKWQVPACRPVPNIDYGKEDLGMCCCLAPRLCLPPWTHSPQLIHHLTFTRAALRRPLKTLLLFPLDVFFL